MLPETWQPESRAPLRPATADAAEHPSSPRWSAAAPASAARSAAAVALGRRVAPDGAQFRVRSGEGQVVVDVTAEVRGPGGLFRFAPGVTVEARAVAAAEAR